MLDTTASARHPAVSPLMLSDQLLTMAQAAERAGYGNVAELWGRLGLGSQPKAYPSIALGVFEATPLEMVTAYTVFPNMGKELRLKHVSRVTSGGSDITKVDKAQPKVVARPDTTFLVTDMMRTVLPWTTSSADHHRPLSANHDINTMTTTPRRRVAGVPVECSVIVTVSVLWVGVDSSHSVAVNGSGVAGPFTRRPTDRTRPTRRRRSRRRRGGPSP
mgnify:CR=1 FL=1